MEQTLFDISLPENTDPTDDTQVNMIPFYYTYEEFKKVKKLGKQLMKKHWPKDHKEGNLSELFLILLTNASKED